MYLMPTPRRSRKLSALLGIIPTTTPGIMPRRFPALMAARYAGLVGLGALPSINVRAGRITPALAAARMQMKAFRRSQAARMRRRGFSGLGDDPTSIWQTDVGSTPTVLPSGQPSDAVTAAYKNLLTSAQASTNPLDYTTPQSAINAGLNPQVVWAAWAKALARFATQDDAINAGIPAGVVTQLWQQSRAYVGTGAGATSVLGWLASNWQIPAAVVGGLFLMKAMGHR